MTPSRPVDTFCALAAVRPARSAKADKTHFIALSLIAVNGDDRVARVDRQKRRRPHNLTARQRERAVDRGIGRRIDDELKQAADRIMAISRGKCSPSRW
jgi:hypothetical protein